MQQPKTILIVEDSEDTRLVLSAILSHDGFRVIEAKDGSEGVTMAARHVPDLILTDVRMPRMDGVEAAEALRKDERTAHIPVVAVTAHSLEEDRREQANALFHSCLSKPLQPRLLRDHVRAIIGGP